MMLKLTARGIDRVRRLASPAILRTAAWSLVVASIILAAAGLILQSLAGTSYSSLSIPLLIISLIPAGGWLVVSALVVSRHPRHPVGWLLCLAVIGAPIDMFSTGYAAYDSLNGSGSLPGVTLALVWLSAGGTFPFSSTGFTLMLLLFPDGHLPSPRWRLVGWAAAAALFLFPPLKALQPGPVDPSSDILGLNPLAVSVGLWSYLKPLVWIAGGIMILSYGAAAVSLIVRLRRAKGEQRQQIKWLVHPAILFAFSLPFLVYAVVEANDRILGIGLAMGFPALMGIFIAVAFSIFKYRLYDIDLIIHRTLVYSALTGALALVYFASVILLQWILPAGSAITIVLSTLVISALFSPLRRRIQNGIDRRFYRRKYDARQTLDAFNAEMRDEVELDTLCQTLLAVVDEALRPAHVSLWLKPSSRRSDQGLRIRRMIK